MKTAKPAPRDVSSRGCGGANGVDARGSAFVEVPRGEGEVRGQEMLLEGQHHGHAVLVQFGFYLKEVGPHVQGAPDVVGIHGISQGHHGQPAEPLRLEPFQDVKPIPLGHVQIEQKKVGKREFTAMAAGGVLFQVGDGFLAVRGFRDNLQAAGAAHGVAEQEAVIRRIVGDENVKHFFGLRAHKDKFRPGDGYCSAYCSEPRTQADDSQLKVIHRRINVIARSCAVPTKLGHHPEFGGLDRGGGIAYRWQALFMKRLVAMMVVTLWASLARADLIDYIRAIVGDSVITRQQVQRTASDDAERRGVDAPSAPDNVLQAIFTETYQAMMRHDIVLQDFKRLEKEKHAKIPENFVDQEVERRITTQFGGDRVRFDKWLQANGMTRQKFREQARDDIIEDLMRREFVPQVIVSPHKIETYYQEHQDKYSVPERIKFRWISMDKHSDDTNSSVRGRMENVLQLVRTGGDFGDLAKTYSERPQRDSDWLETSKVNESYRNEFSKIKPGESTGVIETADSYFIFHLDQRDPMHVQPLNDVRSSIGEQLKRDEWNRRYDVWINKLRNRVLIQEF